MSENVIQTSFAAGELAPSIFARTDLAKYHSGAARLRNLFVDSRSGASTRTGGKFVIQALKSATTVRLIPFQRSVLEPYILEFGDQYIRFISNGASVLEAPFSITAITNANPCSLTIPGHNFVIGDWIFLSTVANMPRLSRNFYKVNLIIGNIVQISDVNGNLVDSTTFGAYGGGATASRVYTLASPYLAADLATLKFTQNATVMTITHPNYAPQNLTITSPTNWTLTPITIGALIAAPTIVSTQASAAGATNYAFVVTAVDINGTESRPSVVGNLISVANIYAGAGSIAVTWNPVTGAIGYNIYQAVASAFGVLPTGVDFGFVGSTVTGTTFVNSGIPPNFSLSPPIPTNPFSSNNNPSVSCYFQQRQCFFASLSQPMNFWLGKVGAFTATSSNFDISSPVQVNDAITGTLVSLQVNAIKHALPMPGGLIMLTSKDAWQLTAGIGANASVAVTAANATAIPQAYNGASDVPPIVITDDILYVQAKGAIVRDLKYNVYANIYTGTDISILSNHLFFGRQITQWAYAEEPFKVVWAVRDDGTMLSLTFVKEQEIYGWARHDTLGLYQSVATVTEGQVDAIYVVVKRFIGGQWLQFIERFNDRTFTYGIEDAFNVDCGLTTANTPGTTNLNANTSTGAVTFTADSPVFSPTTVGQVLRMNGGVADITAFISPTQVSGTWRSPATKIVPMSAQPQPAPSGTWFIDTPFKTVFGLDYLNGQTVSILADGGVVTAQVVQNGQVTLPNPATKVSVGLGYQAQLQTMYLDVGEPTVQGKRKKISALSIRCAETRGLKAGRTFNTIVPLKELNPGVLLGRAIPLITNDIRVVMDPLWDVPGQICIQQDDPLPATVLGVIPEISIGDTVK